MKDQYGYNIPTDLVLLPNHKTLDNAGYQKVMNAVWYKPPRLDIILCSAKAIDYLSKANPENAGVVLKKYKILYRIPRPLKRCHWDNGWYYD